MISHSQDKQFTDENGDSYQKIISTLPKNADNIVSRMSDIIGYSRSVTNDEGVAETKLFMRGTERFEAGSRWKHTPDSITFTYDNLVNAIADAVEAQEKEDGVKATNEHVNVYKDNSEKTYSEVKKDIEASIDKLIKNKDGKVDKDSKYIKEIQKITEGHLGKERKIADTSEEQMDMLVLILDDLKELLEEA